MAKDILQKNISSLSQYNYFLLDFILSMDFEAKEGIEEITTPTGYKTLCISEKGKKFLVHSKYNPIHEAKRIVDVLDFQKDGFIVVFGLGLAYHLFELKEKISKDTRVFIIEHNVNIVKYALSHVDLTSLFNTPQFFLIFGNENQQAELIIKQFGSNFYNLSANIQTIQLPNYDIYSKENLEALQRVSQHIKRLIIAMGNDLQDTLDGFKHHCMNIDALIDSYSINLLKNKFQGKPAIIVASGPSLDKNIHYLKEAEGKALIISCDASLRACESQGVKPDAVASIERYEPTYAYFYKDRVIPEDVVLVGPGLLWPKIFEEYRGKKIIMAKDDTGLEGWWSRNFENMEFVNMGQSCATVAFAVAKQAGCNPIILIGQDLAYTNDKKHSELTKYETNNNRDDDYVELYLEDYDGNKIPSTWVWRVFKDWYEYQISISPDLQVIDATEGGAYIKGTEVMSFKDAIERYCNEPVPYRVYDLLPTKQISDEERINKYEQVIQSIDSHIEKFKKIRDDARKHFDLLVSIEEKYDFKKCTKKDLIKVLEKIQAGDKIVRQVLDSKDAIHTLFDQLVTQTIIHVKKIGNVIDEQSVTRNILLQKNLMYMISESIDKVILKYFEEGKEYIKNKRKRFH